MNAPMTKAEMMAAGDMQALTGVLRIEFVTNRDNIPAALKAIKGWLVWKATPGNAGKFNKVPYYPGTRSLRKGQQGAPDDLVQLGTFDEAMATFDEDARYAGIGFAMLDRFGLVALDVDRCVESGVVREDVSGLTEETYCEISPSGTGIRAFWVGSATGGKNPANGFELYPDKQFVTVTGQQVCNSYSVLGEVLPTLDQTLRETLEGLCRSPLQGSVSPQGDRLKEAAERDPVLQRIIELGLYERDMGHGRHSIECPFEDEHSDEGRAGGDGDTVYFQPNAGGYSTGQIHCMHTHGNDQNKYLCALGIDLFADAPGGDELPPLPDDLPPVPELDLALLPEAIRPWIADISERMQIAPDIPAIGVITALSAAIGRRVQIMPKAHDDWTVVPNLWGMVVAPPGYMKSPALSSVMAPMHKLEQEANHEHDAAMAAWAMEDGRVQMINTATKAAVAAKLKKDPSGEVGGLQPQPEQPIPRRYVVNNFSLEALGEVLIGNPDGVLAYNDELYGLLKMIDQPGREELHSFMLSAWNGDGSFTFDRIKRGCRYLKYVCVSVLGGIQPGRLEEYIRGAARGGSGDSGFVQRFQLLTWPDQRESWKQVDREPDRAAQQAAYLVFERMVGQSPFCIFETNGSPDVRRFDDGAQIVFNEWMESNELLVRGETLPPVMRSHLSKYRSLVPSLALIFAVADGVEGAIPVQYVRQAVGWAEYLRPHAERAFSCATRPDTRHARALLAKIKSGAVVDNFKPFDVYWKGWSLLDNSSSVAMATTVLCDFGYLLEVKTSASPAGGRPSVTYRINPNVMQGR